MNMLDLKTLILQDQPLARTPRGEVLSLTKATEEIIILGGGKSDDCSRTEETNKKQPESKSKQTILTNVDDIIDTVVKDTSGKKTGIEISSHIAITSSTQASILTKKSAGQPLTSLVSKPAPASKKIYYIQNVLVDEATVGRRVMEKSYISKEASSCYNSVDDVINAVAKNVVSKCSVATVDLFKDSPLTNLVCMGCLRHFNSPSKANVDSEKHLDRYELHYYFELFWVNVNKTATLYQMLHN